MPEWKHEIARRLEPLGLPPLREAEIAEELAQHLEDRYQDLLAHGRSEDEAAGGAWREIEASDLLRREVARLERPAPLDLPPPGAPARGRWLGALWQDARYAARTLRTAPGFTLTVMFAVALSIGPTTAILSIGNWLLWRPHPGVTDADRLAVVWFATWGEDGSASPSSVTYSNLAILTRKSTTASGLAGVQEQSASLSTPGTLPRDVGTAHVTGNFFDVLGVRMRAGRGFLPDEDRSPGTPVAVISEQLARLTFTTPEAALDSTVRLNSRPFTVIGVAPSTFGSINPTRSIDIWLPGNAFGYLIHSSQPRPSPFYSFVARLAPGAVFTDLQNELNVLVPDLVEQAPKENRKFATVRARVFPGLGVDPLARPGMRRMVRTMLAVGAVLLVLGCANIANLLVFRITRRGHEIAVRKSLGATQWRLVQLQMMESCMLAVGGAALGLGLAVALKHVMQQLLFPRPPGVSLHVPIDARVLAATVFAALATGALAAAAPAWLAVRGSTAASIARTGTRTATRAPRLRSGLGALQLALSLALLVGALLLVTTLRTLRSVDLGFDPRGVTALVVNLSPHGYTPERALQYYRAVLPALDAHGEFDVVAMATGTPFGPRHFIRIHPPNRDPANPMRVASNQITHDYFRLLAIPIVRGRAFVPEESLAALPGPVVIVNEALATVLYGTPDVVGRTVRLTRTMQHPAHDLRIVGVARDSHWNEITAAPEPFLYQPLGGSDIPYVQFLIRSSLPAVRVGDVAIAIASRTDSSVPFSYVRPLATEIDRGLSNERLFAWVLGMLGALGFVLAAFGLYGLVSQTANERRREFGIRLAVGASRADIIRLIGRYAFYVSLAGVAAGLGLAYYGTRMVESMLFGVTRLDPMIYVAAVGTLVLVVALACIAPALRAIRVQPVEVLRSE